TKTQIGQGSVKTCQVFSRERLRQQTLKQPIDLPRGLPLPPPQGLAPRHHARKFRPDRFQHDVSPSQLMRGQRLKSGKAP
ncbi:MAG: hypothetical protein ABI904_18090, partial [Chloroflexota bacterium]